MKLVLVLLLAALPLHCYAGIGCKLFKEAVDWTLDSEVSKEEYIVNLQPYISSDAEAAAMQNFKQCYLKQPQEVMDRVNHTMQILYKACGSA